MFRHALLLTPLFLSTAACRGEFVGSDGDGTADTGESGVIEDGELWCADVPGATATKGPPQPYTEDIVDSESQSGDPMGCWCANSEEAAFLTNILDGGVAEVLAEHAGDVSTIVEFRNDVWTAAEERCESLADAQWEDRDTDNCQTAIDKSEPNVTPLYTNSEDCSVGVNYGDGYYFAMPEDNWSDYWTLTSVVWQNPANGHIMVDQAFFNSLLSEPAWLLNDAAYIDWNGSDYQMYSVNSGTIAAALGLQTGDLPQTLNEIDVSTVEGAIQAHMELQTESSFELVVLRSSNPVTLVYDLYSS